MQTLVETKPSWMRVLEVELYSKLFPNKIVYGGEDANQLNISITGTKKLATSEDNGVVAISNLTYEDIIKIQQGEYYGIKVWAGYRTSDKYLLFEGEVAYISNKISERKDYTAYLIYGSRFIAQFTQSRINFSFNSSINLYAAYKQIQSRFGISNVNLPQDAKETFLNTAISGFGNATNAIEALNNSVGSFDISTDSSVFGAVLDVTSLSEKRQILIDPNTINFKHGNPTLTSDGLKIYLLPTFNFSPSDIIIIDNALIDISETNVESARSNFKSNFIDSSFKNVDGKQTLGAYMIREITYTLENRGEEFTFEILAKSISLIQNIIGE